VSAVESFLKEFENKLYNVKNVEEELKAISVVVESLEKLYKQTGGLKALTKLSEVIPTSADELLDLENAKYLRGRLSEILRAALLEAISNALLVDASRYTKLSDPNELFSLYEQIITLLSEVKNKDEVKRLIFDNVVHFGENIEDIVRKYGTIIKKYDEILSSVKTIRIPFIQVNLLDLVSSSMQGKPFSQIDQLLEFHSILTELSEFEYPREIECGNYTEPLVAGWCKRYNEHLRSTSELLDKIGNLLREFDLSKVNELKELVKKLKESNKRVDSFREEVAVRVYNLVNVNVRSEDFEEVLKIANTKVKELGLDHIQQKILEQLAERNSISLGDLINKLSSEGYQLNNILDSLYILCSRGVIKCRLEL